MRAALYCADSYYDCPFGIVFTVYQRGFAYHFIYLQGNTLQPLQHVLLLCQKPVYSHLPV